MESRPFDIFLIGPHALLRAGLTHILSAAGFNVAGSAATLSDLASNAFRRNGKTLLIIASTGELDAALEQIKVFKELNAGGKVAVLGNRNLSTEVIAAFQFGANIFFDSKERSDVFIKALELVMLDQTILPPELLVYVRQMEKAKKSSELPRQSDSVAMAPQPAKLEWCELSFREDSILRCIVEGASNKIIAKQMNISEATVKVHVKAILRKVRVRNRTQAAIWAVRHSERTSLDGYDGPKGFAALLGPPPEGRSSATLSRTVRAIYGREVPAPCDEVLPGCFAPLRP
jgi:two-component system, NarL family, nitrate/nitrite response regulator NarL